jgi:hypothetical protein
MILSGKKQVGSFVCSHWQMARMHNKPLVPTRTGEAPVPAAQRWR